MPRLSKEDFTSILVGIAVWMLVTRLEIDIIGFWKWLWQSIFPPKRKKDALQDKTPD